MISPETINLLKPLFKLLAETEEKINMILLGQPEFESAIAEHKEKAKKKIVKKPAQTSGLLPSQDKEALKAKVETMKSQGMTISDIARKLKIGRQTIYNLNRLNWPSAKKPRSKPSKPSGTGKGKSKWSRLHTEYEDAPKSSSANEFICDDCNREFTSVLDRLDAVCPSCGSINISE